jgi:Flp pilus assembly protein TadG
VALTLPLLVVLAAVIIDVAVVASQQVAVVDAARAAARAAAVATATDTEPAAAAAAAAAAPGLAVDRMQVSVRETADVATAEVRFRTRPASILAGRFLPSLELTATESFAREPDSS